uniref:Uncharacterized protein n=1 Tax=Proboscia inermis TaxID=420281 RepID=A0A6T8G0B4_9STRA|mmetsp:Transcript_13951/g.14129  ORF Transcript_13951/g.14129 Transcript_13951/m.14129 type:complete len:127 (+) Transcript_13951:182-562(+)
MIGVWMFAQMNIFRSESHQGDVGMVSDRSSGVCVTGYYPFILAKWKNGLGILLGRNASASRCHRSRVPCWRAECTGGGVSYMEGRRLSQSLVSYVETEVGAHTGALIQDRCSDSGFTGRTSPHYAA